MHDLREVIESAFKKSTSKLAACHQQLKDAAVRTVVDRCAAALGTFRDSHDLMWN